MIRNLSVLGLFLVLFLACYGSVLSADYGFYDDYADLVGGPRGPAITKKILEGRPLYALTTRFFLQTATEIEDLRYARFAGILGITLLAYGVFLTLVRVGFDRIQSFCMGIIVCSTLPFQVYAAWATTAPFPFSALASGLAFLLGERAFETHRHCPKYLLAAGASLMLLVALVIYQPTAMFFWVFAAVALLKPRTSAREVARRFGWYSAIAFAGLLSGFVVLKLGEALYPDIPVPAEVVQDLPAKLMWFLSEPFPKAVNFAILSPTDWFWPEGSVSHYRTLDELIAWCIFIIITVGLVLYFQGTLKERLGKYGIAVSLLFLSYMPNLMAEEIWSPYRTLCSLTSVLVVYVFLAFQGYMFHLRRPLSPVHVNMAAGSFAAACALSAAYHVHFYFVVPQVLELAVMRSQLAKSELSQARGIHVITSGWGKWDTLAPSRHEEFGFPSSYASWNPPAMISLLLSKMAPEYLHLPVSTASPHDSINPPPDNIVMDMRNLKKTAKWILSGEPVTSGVPMIRSRYDVYRNEETLAYVKDPCVPADTEEYFFLYITPVDMKNLTDQGRSYGFNFKNFGFGWHGAILGTKCIATVTLPGYAIARIRTGQFIVDQGAVWDGEFIVTHR